MTGRFISFEGGEGGGKSTQIKLLNERLEALGLATVNTSHVGGTSGGDLIKSMFLADTGNVFSPMTQAMLMNAARHELLEKVIKPALRMEKWVVSDRYSDSTFVYQGLQGVSPEQLRQLQHLALGDFMPDVTFLFDIDPKIGFTRLDRSARVRDRFEILGLDHHRKVREAYLHLAKAEPERFVVLDAAQPVETVTDAIMAELSQRFGVAA